MHYRRIPSHTSPVACDTPFVSVTKLVVKKGLLRKWQSGRTVADVLNVDLLMILRGHLERSRKMWLQLTLAPPTAR